MQSWDFTRRAQRLDGIYAEVQYISHIDTCFAMRNSTGSTGRVRGK
jgi:hypothetical protein